MFFNPAIEHHLSETGQSAADFFKDTIAAALRAFPAIDGVILRIGEGDGTDVATDFKSRLAIQRPRDARDLLRHLLPLFEREGKTLIFRTWTLGAFPIGDLMWNQRTYDAVFKGITSPNLVVSLKYGDVDFFRYLETNPLFFQGPLRKIVELQCRREYEGMGEYPSFVGWLYARHIVTLRTRGANLAGIYAIQAGGWAPFARLAYCANGSVWNELNTFVTVKLFQTDASVERIVADFCNAKGIADVARFLKLLALSDQAIEEGLYVREFAARPIYLQRVRVPPLLWVFWHHVTADGVVAGLHRYLVRDRQAAVHEGYRAVERVRAMVEIGRQLDLATDDLQFQLDTFVILARLREVVFRCETGETHERLAADIAAYRDRYPWGYAFQYPVPGLARSRQLPGLLYRLLLRHRTPYRRSDRLLLSRHLTSLKAVAVRRLKPGLPAFVNQQGMTSDVLVQ